MDRPFESHKNIKIIEKHAIRNDALGQSAWLARCSILANYPNPEAAPEEKQLEWKRQWRQFNSYDTGTIPRPAYSFPEGFLDETWGGAPKGESEEFLRSWRTRQVCSAEFGENIPRERFRRAAIELVDWARKADRLFDAELRDLVGARGQESDVLLTPKRVLKFTKKDEAGKTIRFNKKHTCPEMVAAWPAEFMERIELSNAVFHDDVRLEGVSIRSGEISLVSSQGTLRGSPPTRQEVADFMRSGEFVRIRDPRMPEALEFFHPNTGVAVFDARPDNLIKTVDGYVVPFDLIVVKPEDPDFIHWLQKHSES